MYFSNVYDQVSNIAIHPIQSSFETSIFKESQSLSLTFLKYLIFRENGFRELFKTALVNSNKRGPDEHGRSKRRKESHVQCK